MEVTDDQSDRIKLKDMHDSYKGWMQIERGFHAKPVSRGAPFENRIRDLGFETGVHNGYPVAQGMKPIHFIERPSSVNGEMEKVKKDGWPKQSTGEDAG